MTSLAARRASTLRIAALAASGLGLVAAAFLAALASAEPLLVVRTALAEADVIVVPGGDGPARAERAAGLYRKGAAPRILVTGDGDCDDIRARMIDMGVPRTAITAECLARNTWENAKLSVPILAEMAAQRAVLVTSWFHTRRALACFQAVAPGVRWMSAPVERSMSVWQLVRDPEGVKVAKEYLKIGWYSLRYDLDLAQGAPVAVRPALQDEDVRAAPAERIAGPPGSGKLPSSAPPGWSGPRRGLPPGPWRQVRALEHHPTLRLLLPVVP